MTWHIAALEPFVPTWLGRVMYPIDKTDLDMFHLVHFLALAVVVERYLPRHWPLLTSKAVRPLVLMGQHSLPVFCFGVFLSFAAHWILVQVRGGVGAQLVVSIAGMLLMVAAA
jgi:hypothetical protein